MRILFNRNLSHVLVRFLVALLSAIFFDWIIVAAITALVSFVAALYFQCRERPDIDASYIAFAAVLQSGVYGFLIVGDHVWAAIFAALVVVCTSFRIWEVRRQESWAMRDRFLVLFGVALPDVGVLIGSGIDWHRYRQAEKKLAQ
jgi:hypothetical protein